MVEQNISFKSSAIERNLIKESHSLDMPSSLGKYILCLHEMFFGYIEPTIIHSKKLARTKRPLFAIVFSILTG